MPTITTQPSLRVATPPDPRLVLAEQQVQQAAAVVELIETVLRGESLRRSLDDAAAQLATLLDARIVAIGLVRGRGPRCRVVAQSGLSDLSRDTDAAADLEAAMAEAAAAPQRTHVWTRGSLAESPARGHEPLAKRWNVLIVASAAIAAEGESPTAVLTIIDPPPDRAEATTRLLAAISQPLDAAIRQKRQSDRSIRQRVGRFLRTPLLAVKAFAVAAALCGLVSLALFPVPYRIAATCRTEPVLRRYVVAPYEGLVSESHAEVGDLVAADELLAELDGRDLRWKASGLTADAAIAAKERDVALARRDIPEAQQAELRRLQIVAETESLERKLDQLRIVAPIDGVVLDASIEPHSSLPVSLGDPLYEVGAIAPLRIETEIPADLWDEVAVGQSVALQMDGCPGETFTATITRLRPEIEARDARPVLVADAELPNDDRRLMPGMTGSARVVAGQRPLIWTLTHRAVDRARAWLWW